MPTYLYQSAREMCVCYPNFTTLEFDDSISSYLSQSQKNISPFLTEFMQEP